jgi:hypothetical protein
MFYRLLLVGFVANGLLGTPLYLWLGNFTEATSALALGIAAAIILAVIGPHKGRKRRPHPLP